MRDKAQVSLIPLSTALNFTKPGIEHCCKIQFAHAEEQTYFMFVFFWGREGVEMGFFWMSDDLMAAHIAICLRKADCYLIGSCSERLQTGHIAFK